MKILWIEDGRGIYPFSRLFPLLFGEFLGSRGSDLHQTPFTGPSLQEKVRKVFQASAHDVVLCTSFSQWYKQHRSDCFDLALIDVDLYAGRGSESAQAHGILPHGLEAESFERHAGLWIYHDLLRMGMAEKNIALFIDGSEQDFEKLCWRLCMPLPRSECAFPKRETGFAAFRSWLEQRRAQYEQTEADAPRVSITDVLWHPLQRTGGYRLDSANTHLLIVEDNSRYQEQLSNWLQRFGYRNIEVAYNETEAKKALEASGFDIVVTDMRMESDTGGFTVIENTTRLPSLVIVLTANDTVEHCRSAFLCENVWDYISKNGKGNPFERLNQSIQAAIRYLNLWGGRADEVWAEQHRADLLEQYPDRYVAIINDHVLETAESEEDVLEQIRARRLPLFLPLIKKVELSPPKPEFERLLERGENEGLLFLTGLCWDRDTRKQQREACRETLRSIVALLNSRGGDILVGVQKDHAVTGIDAELAALRLEWFSPLPWKKTPEENNVKRKQKFQDALLQMLKTYVQPIDEENWLKLDFSSREWLEFEFDMHAEHTVARIKVDKSPWPLYLDWPKDRGFYCLKGSETIRLEDAELDRYVRGHWK